MYLPELIHTLSQWLLTSVTYLICEAVGRFTEPGRWASQFTCGAASLCCQLLFGTGEQSDRGERLCGRCQARYDIGAWYLLPGSLRLPCPVGGLGRAPFWHVYVPATVLGCNSNCYTSACAGQQCLGKAACWVGVGSQVRFVTAGTSHGFTARGAADGESKGSEAWCWVGDTDVPRCRALVGLGWGPCRGCVVLSGHRE